MEKFEVSATVDSANRHGPSRKRSSPAPGHAERSPVLGLYLHLPFCLSKCHYCDFNSRPLGGDEYLLERYLAGMRRELELRSQVEDTAGRDAQTLYFGGGTPTLASAQQLTELITVSRTCFPFEESAEISIEANPGTVEETKLQALRQAGVNRLSLGVQSLDDILLRFIGRTHTAEDARRAIELARSAGFDNLSLDLMFAIPGQSEAQWAKTLEVAISFQPEHLSVYGMTIEPGTRFEELARRGELAPCGEEQELAMFQQARRVLSEAGYEHYEISYYARWAEKNANRRCRHNVIYWTDGDYLGVGAGAHSCINGVRWANHPSPECYLELVEADLLPVAWVERLSPRRALGQAIMLNLRLGEGVQLEELGKRYGLEAKAVFAKQITSLTEHGLAELEAGRLRLSERGLPLANEVLIRFLA